MLRGRPVPETDTPSRGARALDHIDLAALGVAFRGMKVRCRLAASDVRVGVPVYTSDGVEVGRVAAVREDLFKVTTRQAWPDYWLPHATIAEASSTAVRLQYPQHELKDHQVSEAA